MKYFLSVFLVFFCLNQLFAQEKHFVFIQSDAKQPFYVSINGKLYSSTASGYVIIPKLADGTYNLSVGFAQNTYPEQAFQFVINKKDLGYNLKNFNEKGWGLFNLQTMDITMAGSNNTNVVAKALSESANRKDDEQVISFDRKKKDTVQLVAKAAPDTSVNIPGFKTDPSVSDNTEKKTKKIDDSSSALSQTGQTQKNSEVVTKTDNRSDVQKVSEIKGAEGVKLSYVEGVGNKADTIQVIIPSSPANSNNPTPATTENSTKKNIGSSESATTTTPASGKNDLKFLDINMSGKKDTAASATKTKESFSVMENSNCKNAATNEDCSKLRKKMAMETTDDKMIAEAKKFYRNKCFTTNQIKGLSTLFLSDESRLKFFNASLLSVSDASQYHTLQSEFIDPAFVDRFKALLQ